MDERLTAEMLLQEGCKSPIYQNFTNEEKETFKATVIDLFKNISDDLDKPFTFYNITKTLIKYTRHQLDNGLVEKMVTAIRALRNPKYDCYSDNDLKISLNTQLIDKMETWESSIALYSEDDVKKGWLTDAFTKCEMIKTYNLRGEAVELLEAGKFTIGDYFRINADEYLF